MIQDQPEPDFERKASVCIFIAGYDLQRDILHHGAKRAGHRTGQDPAPETTRHDQPECLPVGISVLPLTTFSFPFLFFHDLSHYIEIKQDISHCNRIVQLKNKGCRIPDAPEN